MFKIRVPATSANLGPGFDALGLAIDLYLEVTAELSSKNHFYYTGQGHIPDTAHNLMHRVFQSAFKSQGKEAPRVRFQVNNPIPLARGLGSSSAALVAGVALADAFMDKPLGKNGILQLAAHMEGHPDNVAPAILGGFTASIFDGESYHSESLMIPEDWCLLFGIPEFELLTAEARKVLPKSYSREDVIFNASRTALWTLAVAKNNPDLLRHASLDRVHEPYREVLVPNLKESKQYLRDAGAYAAFLSGAGPTLGVICARDTKETCISILETFVSNNGTVIQAKASQGYQLCQNASINISNGH